MYNVSEDLELRYSNALDDLLDGTIEDGSASRIRYLVDLLAYSREEAGATHDEVIARVAVDLKIVRRIQR